MGCRIEVQLDGSLSCVREARELVRVALGVWHLDDLGEVAALLTSEVVTNAVLHAGRVLRLIVEPTPPEVLVEVFDPDVAAIPHVAAPDLGDEHGRGLLLVDQLAAQWGHRSVDGGKVVWFALRDGTPAARPPP